MLEISRFFKDFGRTSRWHGFRMGRSSGSNAYRSVGSELKARKRLRPANYRSPEGAPIATGKMVRMAVVFSEDESIIGLVRDGLNDEWHLAPCSEPGKARVFLLRTDVGIVVIDDAAMEEPTRGWLLDQVHRWAPDALVAYIASAHAPEVERRVRSHGVQYYLSRPVDRERTLRVLHSFLLAAAHR
jgi:hypothetical protein